MPEMVRMIEEAQAAIRKQTDLKPAAAAILGTGLGGLGQRIKKALAIPYGQIPHFPVSTAPGHAGELVFGTLAGLPIVAMEGRFHLYEGYSAAQVTLPVRVMRRLGAKLLVTANASGGLNPQYRPGDIMLLEDHINLMGANPLLGAHDDSLGPRFPDMCEPYDHALLELAERLALREGIRTHRGVYVAVLGPNLETRAEYRFLRGIGADAVGMSTVPEVLVAVQEGMKVLGISCITDSCLPDALAPADIQKIIAVATRTEPLIEKLVCLVLAEWEGGKGKVKR